MRSWLSSPNWSRTRTNPSSPELSRIPAHTRHVSRFTHHASSDLRLPPRAVRAPAERRGCLIADDLARLGIKVNRVPGAPGDVAQVAEDGALLAFLDLGP